MSTQTKPTPTQDCIHLTGIRGYGYIGVLPEEQVLGQWFEVNLTLWLDLAPAGRSDRLEDTLDYGQVVKQVQQLLQTSRFALLERTATAIADRVLQAEQVMQVRVQLTKPNPPIADFMGQVTIDLIRPRPI